MSATLTHFHRSIRVRGGPRSPGSCEITFSFLGSLLWGGVGSSPQGRAGLGPRATPSTGTALLRRAHATRRRRALSLKRCLRLSPASSWPSPLPESFAQQVEGPLCLPSSPDSNVGTAKWGKVKTLDISVQEGKTWKKGQRGRGSSAGRRGEERNLFSV